MKKICIVYNPDSGKDGPDIAALRDLFSDFHVDLTCVAIGKGFAAEVVAAKAAGVQCVVAAGGDGTVNAVAQCAIDNNLDLGVLPVGTLNHFAKDLGLPLDLVDAAKIIAEGATTAIDYSTVNNKVFVNNSSIGIYPSTVLRRKQLEPRVGKWPAASMAVLGAIIRVSTTHLEFELPDKRQTIQTPLVFVGNNKYDLNEVGFANRSQLTGGKLFLYVVRANRTRAILRLTILALFGRRPKGGDYRVETEQLVIHSRKKVLQVAVDGEVIALQPPLTYQIHPGSLSVCTP